MPAIYLRTPLPQEEIHHLKEEFPYYRIYTEEHFRDSLQPEELWKEVEVLFGEQLNSKELELAKELKWVHVPSTELNHLCYEAIKKKERIILTITRETYAPNVAEWAIASFLTFSKKILFWKSGDLEGKIHRLKSDLLVSRHLIWLQLGLTSEGSEILKRAKVLGLQTWGVHPTGSFHPHCDKVFTPDAVHSLLPAVDVVCLFSPKKIDEPYEIRKKELELMKQGAIVILFSQGDLVDPESLIWAVKTEQIRGLALDTKDDALMLALQPIYDLPSTLITPDVASYPRRPSLHPYRLFRHNLRQFLHYNFQDMHQRV